VSRRLPPVDGEWIDRNAPIFFTFEGRRISGFRGDSITTALLASGETVLGRSFKYHRPRSVLSAANHDINVMVETEESTNIRGDVEAAEDGALDRERNEQPTGTTGRHRRERGRHSEAEQCGDEAETVLAAGEPFE